MNIQNNNYSVIEIQGMLARKELIVNETYQRGSGIWPTGARSYFIDTMLNNFPFPKIYFYESLDRTKRKVIREIVDGQQRISSMMAFVDDKFRLTTVSTNFAGKKFSDLDEDVRDRFLAYSVPVDVIRNAEPSEILEMFRRMNAFTLPLNEAEKRHSIFNGQFKWFVNRLADELNSFFVTYGVFTNKQIVRMADAELLSEIVLALEGGVISSSPALLRGLYEKYDNEFELEAEYGEKISSVFGFIASELSPLRDSYMMKPYALLTLILGLLHNRFGLLGVLEETDIASSGTYVCDVQTALQQLQTLTASHEEKDITGKFREYVLACEGATTRRPSRITRTKYVLLALQGRLA